LLVGDRDRRGVRPRGDTPRAALSGRGQPRQLRDAVEALAGALAVLGERAQAETILGPFSGGDTFLELNAEPLDRYADCEDSTEVVAVQQRYLDARDG
jgi:pre-rRNA-processing protein TSR3